MDWDSIDFFVTFSPVKGCLRFVTSKLNVPSSFCRYNCVSILLTNPERPPEGPISVLIKSFYVPVGRVSQSHGQGARGDQLAPQMMDRGTWQTSPIKINYFNLRCQCVGGGLKNYYCKKIMRMQLNRRQ